MEELTLLNELEEYQEVETKIVNNLQEYGSNINKSQSINFIHLNIRSIQKNFDELLILITTSLSDFSVIILSETWKINSIDNYQIPGYVGFFNESELNQNDGVIIYVKKSLPADMQIYKFDNLKFLKVTIHINNITIGITGVYRLPSLDVNMFLNELNNFLKHNRVNNNIELFIGDININILNKSLNYTNDYLNIMSKYGYVSYINKPTRITTETTSCIDHIFIKSTINECQFKFSSFILECTITDHCPVLLNLEFNNNIETLEKNSKNQISTINYNKLLQLLSQENWEHVTNYNNSNICTDNFIYTFKEHIKSATKIIKIPNYKTKIKPWITTGITESIKKRDQLKKKLLKDKNNLILLNQYKNYRNKLTSIIKKTKDEYYRNEINNSQNNLKKIWQIINNATNSAKTKNNKINIKDENDELIVQDNDQKAKAFNKYFINIGSIMAETITPPPNPIMDNHIVPNSIFLTPVSQNEIIKYISSLKNNSATGLDQISVKLIKYCHLHLIKPLTHIINTIFSTGLVPTKFKESIVTPVYKSGSRTDKTNYRPISVINNFAKIFEKALKTRLEKFLNENKIISKNQYGFRNNFSTNDAIYKLTSIINSSLHNNKKCIAVFLDLAKAFDTVSHSKLLQKLENIGIRGTALDVLATYLTDRKQYVKVENKISDSEFIQTGIPQGTVLAPILFLIFINNFCNISNISAKLVSYADDTALIFEGSDWDEVKNKVSSEMKIIKHWLDQNLLSLNITKTKFINFSIQRSPNHNISEINIQNTDYIIHNTRKIKYLGVILDENLKWQEHILYITDKIRKLVRKFYMLRDILKKKTLINVYNALVESIIRYGIIVWGGAYENALKPVKVIQKFILKIIMKKSLTYPSDQLFKECQCLNIKNIYVLESIIFVYKNIKTYNLPTHVHNTRSVANSNLLIMKYDRTHQLNYIDYLGPLFYNKLPLSIKNINNIATFRYRVKNFIATSNNIFN